MSDNRDMENVVKWVVKPATAKEVAEWMVERIKLFKHYPQYLFVLDIKKEFGHVFIYTNENGNDAIDKKVLREFRKLTKDTVVWERGDLEWRLRKSYDSPGKRQAD